MDIEMYVGYLDHTWQIVNVEIPDDTPENEIDTVAETKLEEQFKETEIAFVGVYHIWEVEESDEDGIEEPESETKPLDVHEVKDRVLLFIQKNSDRDGEISTAVLKENFTPEELDLMRETGYIYEPIIGKVKAT